MNQRQSYIKLHASEVKRLAMESIAEIEAARKKHVEAILNVVKDLRCSHLFGLVTHAKYPTRESAMEHCPEVQLALRYGSTDEITCDLLRNAAQMLLDNEKILFEDKVLYITMEDFRALT